MPHQKRMVVEELLKEIDAGELLPGQNIDEQKLMDRLGVSRTPVREALIQLEIEGLAVRIPRKGVVIYKPTLEEFLLISEVNAKLHGMATGLAARRMNEKNRLELVALTEACLEHVDKYGNSKADEYFWLNYKYHTVILDSVKNDYLLKMITLSSRRILAYYRTRYNFPGITEKSAQEHQQLTALILDRDDVGAERLMYDHILIGNSEAMDLIAARH